MFSLWKVAVFYHIENDTISHWLHISLEWYLSLMGSSIYWADLLDFALLLGLGTNH